MLSERVNEENLPLLHPTEHHGDYGGRSLGCGEYSSVGTAEVADSAANRSNKKKREGRADMVDNETFYQNPENHQEYSGDGNNSSSDCSDSVIRNGGPTVTCRICNSEIIIEGRGTHIVRCQSCNEVTPIRAAPPGKKYVRCPCNCLLICKASSNRIACPRPNCRRVITLVDSDPVGTAVRAPAGTCRVLCFYCAEMFMFNTLANTVAHCPHCRKATSVGVSYARSRALIYAVCFAIIFLVLIVLVLNTFNKSGLVVYLFWAILIVGSIICFYRFIYFIRLKISQVLGPI